jgi:hypothetical protein
MGLCAVAESDPSVSARLKSLVGWLRYAPPDYVIVIAYVSLVVAFVVGLLHIAGLR